MSSFSRVPPHQMCTEAGLDLVGRTLSGVGAPYFCKFSLDLPAPPVVRVYEHVENASSPRANADTRQTEVVDFPLSSPPGLTMNILLQDPEVQSAIADGGNPYAEWLASKKPTLFPLQDFVAKGYARYAIAIFVEQQRRLGLLFSEHMKQIPKQEMWTDNPAWLPSSISKKQEEDAQEKTAQLTARTRAYWSPAPWRQQRGSVSGESPPREASMLLPMGLGRDLGIEDQHEPSLRKHMKQKGRAMQLALGASDANVVLTGSGASESTAATAPLCLEQYLERMGVAQRIQEELEFPPDFAPNGLELKFERLEGSAGKSLACTATTEGAPASNQADRSNERLEHSSAEEEKSARDWLENSTSPTTTAEPTSCIDKTEQETEESSLCFAGVKRIWRSAQRICSAGVASSRNPLRANETEIPPVPGPSEPARRTACAAAAHWQSPAVPQEVCPPSSDGTEHEESELLEQRTVGTLLVLFPTLVGGTPHFAEVIAPSRRATKIPLHGEEILRTMLPLGGETKEPPFEYYDYEQSLQEFGGPNYMQFLESGQMELNFDNLEWTAPALGEEQSDAESDASSEESLGDEAADCKREAGHTEKVFDATAGGAQQTRSFALPLSNVGGSSSAARGKTLSPCGPRSPVWEPVTDCEKQDKKGVTKSTYADESGEVASPELAGEDVTSNQQFGSEQVGGEACSATCELLAMVGGTRLRFLEQVSVGYRLAAVFRIMRKEPPRREGCTKERRYHDHQFNPAEHWFLEGHCGDVPPSRQNNGHDGGEEDAGALDRSSAVMYRLAQDLQLLWSNPHFLRSGGVLGFPSYSFTEGGCGAIDEGRAKYSNRDLFPQADDCAAQPLTDFARQNLRGNDAVVAGAVALAGLGEFSPKIKTGDLFEPEPARIYYHPHLITTYTPPAESQKADKCRKDRFSIRAPDLILDKFPPCRNRSRHLTEFSPPALSAEATWSSISFSDAAHVACLLGSARVAVSAQKVPLVCKSRWWSPDEEGDVHAELVEFGAAVADAACANIPSEEQGLCAATPPVVDATHWVAVADELCCIEHAGWPLLCDKFRADSSLLTGGDQASTFKRLDCTGRRNFASSVMAAQVFGLDRGPLKEVLDLALCGVLKLVVPPVEKRKLLVPPFLQEFRPAQHIKLKLDASTSTPEAVAQSQQRVAQLARAKQEASVTLPFPRKMPAHVPVKRRCLIETSIELIQAATHLWRNTCWGDLARAKPSIPFRGAAILEKMEKRVSDPLYDGFCIALKLLLEGEESEMGTGGGLFTTRRFAEGSTNTRRCPLPFGVAGGQSGLRTFDTVHPLDTKLVAGDLLCLRDVPHWTFVFPAYQCLRRDFGEDPFSPNYLELFPGERRTAVTSESSSSDAATTGADTCSVDSSVAEVQFGLYSSAGRISTEHSKLAALGSVDRTLVERALAAGAQVSLRWYMVELDEVPATAEELLSYRRRALQIVKSDCSPCTRMGTLAAFQSEMRTKDQARRGPSILPLAPALPDGNSLTGTSYDGTTPTATAGTRPMQRALDYVKRAFRPRRALSMRRLPAEVGTAMWNTEVKKELTDFGYRRLAREREQGPEHERRFRQQLEEDIIRDDPYFSLFQSRERVATRPAGTAAIASSPAKLRQYLLTNVGPQYDCVAGEDHHVWTAPIGFGVGNPNSIEERLELADVARGANPDFSRVCSLWISDPEEYANASTEPSEQERRCRDREVCFYIQPVFHVSFPKPRDA
eukprot:CAMPEP_0178988644 /NCGR_PEP_ID=MMETSP0795-20121207/3918_1 /TAXON_ID=88552 /ORGANISM="Amoebophrya sp., Strain Ameob2" /LENGTH=1725 /DNA_ID=CAMNT_0020679927 /DNA_START=53 /DNA_END=5230 /DNA_ORIENTATION=+